jgi:hypothetical protein
LFFAHFSSPCLLYVFFDVLPHLYFLSVTSGNERLVHANSCERRYHGLSWSLKFPCCHVCIVHYHHVPLHGRLWRQEVTARNSQYIDTSLLGFPSEILTSPCIFGLVCGRSKFARILPNMVVSCYLVHVRASVCYFNRKKVSWFVLVFRISCSTTQQL